MPDHAALLGWIQHTGPSTLIRQSSWAVMALESIHLIGLALLGGAAVIAALAALRPTGLGGLSVPTLVTGLAPLRRAGLFLMVISGALITLSMPFKYYANAAFRWKMLLLSLVLLTSWVLGRMSHTISPVSDALTPSRHRAARVLALAVLLLWLGVACCGRLIGFL
jgi:hypothetical protein